MTAIYFVIGIVFFWTAGLNEWMVAYATGIAQLGIWLTLFSLIPFSVFWISLKRQAFLDQSSDKSRVHWGLNLKISF